VVDDGHARSTDLIRRLKRAALHELEAERSEQRSACVAPDDDLGVPGGVARLPDDE
jgi:hypothetical protein